MSKTRVRVTLIGLNRHTVSLGMALKAANDKPNNAIEFYVVGQDGERKIMEAARQIGALDEIQQNAKTAVQEADIVIVGLVSGVHEAVYEYFAPALKAGAVVLDLSVMKAPIVELAQKYFPRDAAGSPSAYLVGIKPLVSNAYLFEATLQAGAAQADLFTGSEMIIAPQADCPPEAVKLASDLAEMVGMKPRFLTPAEYDGLADFTERLPPLLALGLFATLFYSQGQADLQRAINPDFALLLNSLRQHESSDLIDLWVTRPQDTINRLDELSAIIQSLRDLLQRADEEETRAFIKKLLVEFHLWETRRQGGKWPDGTPEMPEVNSGLFQMMFGGFFSRKGGTG